MILAVAVVLTGCLIGLLVGATGIGAGTLGAPFLIFVLKIDPFVAVGTDLFMNAIVKMTGSIMHKRANNTEGSSIAPLAISAVLGSILGLLLLALLKSHGDARGSREILRHVIGVVLLLCALAIVLSARVRTRHLRFDTPVYLGAAGGLIAAIATATGVGVGSLSVPALHFIKGREQVSKIVGTSLIYGAIVTTIGAAGNALLGNVNYGLAALLLAGALPGVGIGSMLATRAPAALRPVVVALVAISGVRLLVGGS